LITEICCEDELQMVCTPSRPLAEQTSVAPELLAHYNYTSREAGSGTREVIDRYLQVSGLSPGESLRDRCAWHTQRKGFILA
jgi:DNA-binding transcriptional LysR family regulator